MNGEKRENMNRVTRIRTKEFLKFDSKSIPKLI